MANNDVGRRMKAWREHRGLTMQQVADRSGAVTKQTVSYTEAGESDIAVGKLLAICSKAFRCTIMEFFGPLPRKGEERAA